MLSDLSLRICLAFPFGLPVSIFPLIKEGVNGSCPICSPVPIMHAYTSLGLLGFLRVL